MEHSLEKERIPLNEDSIPSLFSFITFRKESVGGFLFNPYLFNEIPLSNIEIRILEHCNGNFSLRDITGRIRDELSLSHDQAYQCIHEAMNVFEGYCAINWLHQRQDFADPGGGTAGSMHPSAGCQARDNSILSAPLSVLWEITNECNLRCKHCLIDAGVQDKEEMSLEEVKSTIVQLAELNVLKITFGGGEPLVRKDLMDILDYATGFDLGIKLSTNGMLVNDQLIDRLGDTNVCSVQVSVDGLESTHNAFRGSERSFKKATSA
ncbi:MAG: radical SAM protein, partial [Methanosarcinaceae archaeon]